MITIEPPAAMQAPDTVPFRKERNRAQSGALRLDAEKEEGKPESKPSDGEPVSPEPVRAAEVIPPNPQKPGGLGIRPQENR